MTEPMTKQQADEVRASFVLIAVTLAALVAVNSPLSALYKDLISLPVSVRFGDFVIDDPLKNWIKNALMAVFFLLVGLELKSEFKEGVLADRKSATLPFITAAAGMLVPALIYLGITSQEAGLANGWAIPSATDIAFAVGVIGLLGSRIPPGLKALLLAIAVIDDLGAIIIIAVFYTADLNMTALALAAACIGAMAVLNHFRVRRTAYYILIGVALWLCLMKSGVNATLAGVVTALFVPLRTEAGSPLHDLADAIKWPVTFVIMPVFAFANAGAPLGGMSLSALAEPVTAGVALGLLIGKPVGITLATWLAVQSGLCKLPAGVNWGQIVGMGFVAGIGFTMSLFVGALAFTDAVLIDEARLGTLTGSLFAATFGAVLLILFAHKSPASWADTMRRLYKREVW